MNDELNQLSALIEGESDEVSVLANVAAALHHSSNRFFWTGFYLLKNDRQLHLGPFQGPPACYSIPIGKGVCGTAFAEKRTYIVPDVEAFPGHIVCSSLSRSEIVVPIFKNRRTRWCYRHRQQNAQCFQRNRCRLFGTSGSLT